MTESFENYRLKDKETLQWVTVGASLEAQTTIGKYRIRNGCLYFTSKETPVEVRIGRFKDPKAKARSHFLNDAV
jgi:hypothetical protein